MKVIKTEIEDCFILEPSIFNDARGYFLESYNHQVFQKATQMAPYFVQDNESQSSFGVIRGLHAQETPYAQAKLVRVVQGKVLDVVVDARFDSPSFGQVVSVILDGISKRQLFVPKGCLHGFSVLEDETIFSYKCDAFYNKESEFSLNPLDPDLGIDWQIEDSQMLISEKDRNAQDWNGFVKSNKI